MILIQTPDCRQFSHQMGCQMEFQLQEENRKFFYLNILEIGNNFISKQKPYKKENFMQWMWLGTFSSQAHFPVKVGFVWNYYGLHSFLRTNKIP